MDEASQPITVKPEFVRESDDYGLCFDVRCPECRRDVRLAQYGGPAECSCGRVWKLEITAIGTKQEDEL